MARLKSELEVTCPCCQTTLVIDLNLGRVVSHHEPERGNKPELSEAQRILSEEAERREAPPVSAPSQQARACCAEAWCAQFRARSPHGAPLRRISVSGPALPGTRHWRQSQSSEAPRRAAVVPPGRGPGASRVQVYETCPRAPHLAPSSRRLRKTPLSERGEVEIAPECGRNLIL